MTDRQLLWSLAITGSIIGAIADTICVLSARNHSTWGVWLAAFMLALGAPIWYKMSSLLGGALIEPAIIWNISATILSILMILGLERTQTPKQWIGLAVMLFGYALRSI